MLSSLVVASVIHCALNLDLDLQLPISGVGLLLAKTEGLGLGLGNLLHLLVLTNLQSSA